MQNNLHNHHNQNYIYSHHGWRSSYARPRGVVLGPQQDAKVRLKIKIYPDAFRSTSATVQDVLKKFQNIFTFSIHPIIFQILSKIIEKRVKENIPRNGRFSDHET